MSLYILNEKNWFPPVEKSLSNGLLAAGGNLSVDRLLLAYKKGIFPWYDHDLPLWWSPDPRFVLFPQNLKISKSMRSILNNEKFTFKMNTAFKEVIISCKNIRRKNQDGSWINNEVIDSYLKLFHLGYAFSAEAWHKNQLSGGLYGIKMGNIIFGESMFSKISNSSKFAFIKLIQKIGEKNIRLIDCQVYTQHLESLGAEMISRSTFVKILKEEIKQD